MQKQYHHDHPGSAISSDAGRELEFTFEEFELWLKSEWEVVEWHYADWRETQNPHYDFIINWGRDIGWDSGKISGFIPEHKFGIHWGDNCSADFVLEFIRKFMARFPSNSDHVCFHDGDCGLSVYRPDLTDEELYDCITGAVYTLDNDVQRRVSPEYRREDIARAVAERAWLKK